MRHTAVQNKLTVFTSILVLAFLLMAAPAQAGWVTQTSGVTNTLEEVFCINATTCFVVGAGDVILKTTDGGRTWVRKTSAAPPTAFYDVHFVDSMIGWAVGGSGVIRRTTNGGETWTAQTSGTSATLYGVHARTAASAWAVGSSSAARRTSDGGMNWTGPTGGTGIAAIMYSVHFPVNNINGWASASGGFIKKTSNSGLSWTDQSAIPGAPTLYDIQMIDESVGYAVGSESTIVKTMTGGMGLPSSDWVPQNADAGAGGLFRDVHFIDVNNGWAVGDSGLIRRTTNGGSSWLTTGSTPTPTGFRGIYFVDAENGWIVGSGGTIWRYDNSGPTGSVSIDSGAATTNSTTATLSLTCTDAVGVCSQMRVAADGVLDVEMWETFSTVKTIFLPGGDGTKTIPVQFRDNAVTTANVSATYTDTIVLDTTAPTTTITSNPAASTTSTSATFEFTASEAATFECQLDMMGGFASCTSPRTYSGLAVGSHTFEVRATDSARNVDATSASYTWTITAPSTPPPADTTAPETTITSSPASSTTSTSAMFEFTASEAATFSCSLDAASFSSCSSPVSYMGLSVGTHTFRVRATDTAGNPDPTLAVYTWTITAPSTPPPPPAADMTAPSVGPVSPTSAMVGTIVTFSASYSDAVGVTSCTLIVDNIDQGSMMIGEAMSGTATRTHNFTLSGAHTAQARCLDAAGNVGLGVVTSVSVISSGTTTGPDTTAPTAPTGLTRTSSDDDTTSTFTWFSATDNVGVTAYHVQIDGSAFVGLGLTTSYTAPLLAVGTHTIGVRSADGAGNVSSVTELSFTITAPPSTPAAPITPSTPSIPATPTTPSTPSTPSTGSTGGPPFTLAQMSSDAATVATGDRASLLATTGVVICQMSEADATARVDRVFGTIADATVRAAIINFTACGTVSTLHLGAGERLGVVNSYKAAFGRLPSIAEHWNDITKISNGRFPGETSKLAERDAEARFRRIYLRAPDMNQQNDKAAVTVMAYGLRPLPRNVNSERASIKIFKGIFGYAPSSATDWDAVRAIAYSGAKR